ncbi:MAG: response regulator [Alphaproteobacteria bacterium]|nr:response regulator [Alphaproteobacteria bacterium]MCD8570496.1 response regulator [Alphaproteobacteria bacterium]
METLNILIIDDNSIDREAIRRSLPIPYRDYELTVHEASNGREAVDLSHNQNFGCIFLDYRLPDMDGLAVLRALYDADSGQGPAPVVMMTGQGNEKVMIEALRWGAQDYIDKDNITTAAIEIAMTKARELYELRSSRKLAEEQLTQSQKMEAVGQLTSGVAHDFNNLLTVIIGNIHMVRRRLEKGLEQNNDPLLEELQSKIDLMDSAAHKGAELVRRLMVFSRQRQLTQEVTDINNCVNETFELLTRTLGEAIEIDLILTDAPWPVSIDTGQFENALINLAVNARDAMKGIGKLTIETSNVILDDSYTLQHPNVSEGPYVLVTISDTGSGIPPETLSRIFEPFYTTKQAGEGTGLGLSMVYGFIKQSGGHVNVYSEKDHGTVFRIYLPRVRVEEDALTSAQDATAPSGKETVLVAEDDDHVRHMACTMLERLGYKTLQAKNGNVAMELLKKEHKQIDVVFTDIVMPGGMSGIKLVQQMREYYPGIKVLYTSGYTENAIPDYQLSVGEELISKPYRKETLAQKIRKVLDAEIPEAENAA